MKKSTNKKQLKPILVKLRNNVREKSKNDKQTENINYDFTLLNEIFKGVENRKFISTDLNRIAE
ncbi:MAG: hypothetical protein IJ312_05285, partial [Treponema sp.]|nr:hypothetical protein [Treponema sp.]